MAVFVNTLSACQADETLRRYGADAKLWILVGINGTAVSTRTTLTFPQAGTIVGDGPCNSYSAPMTAPYPWFEIGLLVSTKRACRDISAEDTFFQALGAVSLSEVLGDTLVLSNPDGLEMVFKTSE